MPCYKGGESVSVGVEDLVSEVGELLLSVCGGLVPVRDETAAVCVGLVPV